MTSIVKQLEHQGLVSRQRQTNDGRVVLVKLTETGIVALANYRSRIRSMLGTYLAEIPDEQIEALAAATQALTQLTTLLQQRPAR